MGFIYKITNDINDKMYIGKTSLTIEDRWKEHIRDSKKRVLYEKRPLYNAMNKYGVDKFHIDIIEQTGNLDEREIYWIKYYNTYKNGYNATLGGDGKTKFNYNEVVELYKKFQNVREVARQLNADRTSIEDILHAMEVEVLPGNIVIGKKKSKAILQIDKNTNQILNEFSNAREASEKLGICFSGISKTCLGKQKTCGGYKWKYKDGE